ncbi:A24 family peptidase [archaeon]|nr:A24 family peptidase [archaeon]
MFIPTELIPLVTILSALIALIGCLIAAYTDFKWGIVPDKLNYALIALGLICVPLQFNPVNTLIVYSLAVIIFVIGLLAYTFGQLGGGDVKLFTALTLLLPFYPSTIAQLSPLNPIKMTNLSLTIPFIPEPIIYPFIISIFFASAVMAVFFVSLNYIHMLWKDRDTIKDRKNLFLKGIANALLVSIAFTLIWSIINPMMTIVIIPMALGSFLLPFRKTLLEKYVVMEKQVKDLNDDDVLALEVMDQETKEKLGLSNRRTFFNIELNELKTKAEENNIKKVFVSEFLPKFVPYIFLSLLLNLLMGDAFLWLLSLKAF